MFFAFAPSVPIFARSRSRTPSISPRMAIATIVTGASGRTGRLTLQRLVSSPDFSARGLVRSRSRAVETLAAAGITDCDDVLVEGDVRDVDSLRKAFEGMDALIVLSSAVPQMNPPVEGAPPSFFYVEGEEPAAVDGDGGVNQIEVAKEMGMQVVWVGSMVSG